MADGGLQKIANAASASDRRWPPAGGHLRTFLLGSYADLGNDEFHQFRPWRVRHAWHVRQPAGCRVAWRRTGGVRVYSGILTLRPWSLRLPLLDSLCAARPHAFADSFDFRARIVASLHRVLDLFGEFRFASADLAVGHPQRRRGLDARAATGRRRHSHLADNWPAPDADPHQGRQPAAGSLRGSRCGDADGYQARPDAGLGVGIVCGSGRYRGRVDGDRLPLVAFGRRDLWPDCVRGCRAWRFWQRARRAARRADHRIDPGVIRILVRTDL